MNSNEKKMFPLIVKANGYTFLVSRKVKVVTRNWKHVLTPESESEIVSEFKAKGYSKPVVRLDTKRIYVRRG